MTSLQYSAGALVVDSQTNNSGANLVLSPETRLQLQIPSLGLNVFLGKPAPYSYPARLASGGAFASGIDEINLATFGLSYTGFGKWSASSTVPVSNTGAFVFGYETPIASMPMIGTATYAGSGTVVGTVYNSTANNGIQAVVGGDASLTANFSSGTVTGGFTNMIATPDNGITAQPWNNVSVSASIASGTSRFSGTTSATSAPAGTFTLKNTATGHINGGFYGPSADELGAVWTLSNGDGTGSAIGVVGATKH